MALRHRSLIVTLTFSALVGLGSGIRDFFVDLFGG